VDKQKKTPKPWNTTAEELKNRNRMKADKHAVKKDRSYQRHTIYSLTKQAQLIIYKKPDFQTRWNVQFSKFSWSAL